MSQTKTCMERAKEIAKEMQRQRQMQQFTLEEVLTLKKFCASLNSAPFGKSTVVEKLFHNNHKK